MPMWGWKTVERLVDPSVSSDQAREMLRQKGFRLYALNPTHTVYKKAGRQNPRAGDPCAGVPPEDEDPAIELAIAHAHSGVFLQLRYEAFTLFDTGDLQRYADKIAGMLAETSAASTSQWS